MVSLVVERAVWMIYLLWPGRHWIGEWLPCPSCVTVDAAECGESGEGGGVSMGILQLFNLPLQIDGMSTRQRTGISWRFTVPHGLEVSTPSGHLVPSCSEVPDLEACQCLGGCSGMDVDFFNKPKCLRDGYSIRQSHGFLSLVQSSESCHRIDTRTDESS